MRIIDFHTHLDDRWFDTPLLDQKSFLAGMDRCGISIACVFTLMGFYEDAPRHNAVLLERASKNPDRLLPFITVDPKLGDAAVEELDRCIATGKFRGIKFHPWLQAFAPSMVKKTMIAILERAAEADLPVIFHDGTPPYATSFQVAATARWVPKAKIVLGHAGLADYCLAAAQLVRDIENLYACVSVPRIADVENLVNVAGVEKILFGSDVIADTSIIDDRLDTIRMAEISDDAKNAIFWRNPARLLHL